MTEGAQLRSTVSRLPSRLGWLLVALGAIMEILYHGPALLCGVQWPPVVETIGESGHTVIFIGIVLLIFAVLRSHQMDNA